MGLGACRWGFVRSARIWAQAMSLVFAFSAGSLQGQGVVIGTVRDGATGAAVPGVEITHRLAIGRAITDTTGRFSAALPVGQHLLHFVHPYFRSASVTVQVVAPDTMFVDVRLFARVSQLPQINVVEQPNRLMPPGFEDRMRLGFGGFIQDSTLRKHERFSLSNVLTGQVPGVRIAAIDGRSIVTSSRGGQNLGAATQSEPGGRCPMAIWVNGVQTWSPALRPRNRLAGARAPGVSGAPDLNQWLVQDLEAIEVYQAASVPAQFRGAGSGCGVVVLWLRMK